MLLRRPDSSPTVATDASSDGSRRTPFTFPLVEPFVVEAYPLALPFVAYPLVLTADLFVACPFVGSGAAVSFARAMRSRNAAYRAEASPPSHCVPSQRSQQMRKGCE